MQISLIAHQELRPQELLRRSTLYRRTLLRGHSANNAMETLWGKTGPSSVFSPSTDIATELASLSGTAYKQLLQQAAKQIINAPKASMSKERAFAHSKAISDAH